VISSDPQQRPQLHDLACWLQASMRPWRGSGPASGCSSSPTPWAARWRRLGRPDTRSGRPAAPAPGGGGGGLRDLRLL